MPVRLGQPGRSTDERQEQSGDMDQQLEGILILQDLDLMIAEAADRRAASRLAQLGFHVDRLDRLRAARTQATDRLSPETLRLYERLSRRYSHRVVAVQSETCLGCFVTQPTGFSCEGNSSLHTCQSCGRILFW